jgi:hypothetical protein
MITVSITGKKRSTLYDVSSMMTTTEKVSLVYPTNIAADVTIA